MVNEKLEIKNLKSIIFSQASLQDYVDCPRRFQLRYLRRLAWPAIEAEPVLENEMRKLQGERFHRLVQQHILGIPADRLTRMLPAGQEQANQLCRWWENYLDYAARLALDGQDGPRMPLFSEVTLTASAGSFRLIAKYDAILMTASPEPRLIILDWKTSKQRTRREILAARLQTRIYSYLLVRAGSCLGQTGSILPEQVEMIYWYAEHPDLPERFPYNLAQFQKDEQYLCSLITEIQALAGQEFPQGKGDKACKFCTYRSLCARGVQAGRMDEENTDEDSQTIQEDGLALDFEHIPEISF